MTGPEGSSAPLRRGRLGRVLRSSAVAMSVTVLVTVVGAAIYLKILESRIPRIPWEPPPAAAGKALNFLLLGSDTREGASDEELAELGTEFEGGRRSDTIILLHLSADRKKSVLVSFPRDAYVEIPGYGRGKINSAYGKGDSVAEGAAALRATLEKLTGLPIHHYIGIDFRGFVDVVDALDGVPICLREPAVDPKAGLDLPAGRHTVRGKQALAFVRTRSIDGRVDFGRIERQQQFLAATLNKATSLGVLTDPGRLTGFLAATTDALTINEGLGLGTLKDLALSMRGLKPGKVIFLTAPVADADFRVGEERAVKLDEAAGDQLWQAITTDGPLPGAEPSSTDPSSPPPTAAVSPAPERTGIAPAPFEQRTAADDPCS